VGPRRQGAGRAAVVSIDWDALMLEGARLEAARLEGPVQPQAPVSSQQQDALSSTGAPVRLAELRDDVQPVIVLRDFHDQVARGYCGFGQGASAVNVHGFRFTAGLAGATIEDLRYDVPSGAYIYAVRLGTAPPGALVPNTMQNVPITLQRPSSVVESVSRAAVIVSFGFLPFASNRIEAPFALAPGEVLVVLDQVLNEASRWSVLWSEP